MKLLFVKSILVVFFGMFLLLTSCAKKSSSAQNRTGAIARGDATALVGTLALTKCTNGQSVIGRVYDDTGGNAFRNSWVDFFSALMADTQIGDIKGAMNSTTTGVNFEVKMKVVNNQLNLSETKLAMVFTDSAVNTKNADGEIIDSIKMNFTSAQSGSSLSNVAAGGTSGNFTLVFSDPYGNVTVTGSFNQSTATGTVTFQNTKHYNNETPKSGTLGKFSQNTCGLFH